MKTTQELIEREKGLLNMVKDLKASINHEKRTQNLFMLGRVKKSEQHHKALISSLEKLEKYESTGLSPEQICEIDKLYQEQAAELMKFKKDN